MTDPGVGPITALATDVLLVIQNDQATARRWRVTRIIPRENSSGGRQRLGGLSKQVIPLFALSLV